MRVLFLGSGRFALPSLEILHRLAHRHPLVGVITRPDRPSGRGRGICQKLAPTPVKTRALELGLRPLTPRSVNDASVLQIFKEQEVDVAMVADYGEILRATCLSMPRTGAFNLHGSLLPKYRGAAPVAWAILRGERVTGVTMFRIERALDSGPIVASRSLDILPDENAYQLEGRLAVLAAELLEDQLDSLAAGSFQEVRQESSRVTYAPKLRKCDGLINWSDDADSIGNLVRAMHPWPLAYSFRDCGGGELERTIFLRVAPDSEGGASSDEPGCVVEAGPTGFTVACGRGRVRVLELQRGGRKPMDAGAYQCGRPLRVGDRFR